MIKEYKKTDYLNLLEFINDYGNKNLYITRDNRRVFITNGEALKQFIKDVKYLYILEENSRIKGLIAIWIANNNRNYVKILSDTSKNVYKLITVLLWNFKKDLYIKVHKYSDYIIPFKQKGFRFFHSRGNEILLRRIKYERNFIRNRN